MSRFKELIREVHRRSLWQVLLVYIGGALVGYQAIQALTEGLGLPQWFPALAILLFIVGLPIVLATSFVQEGFSSAGQDPTLLPDSGVGTVADVAGARRLFTWRNAILGGAIAFGLWGVGVTGWLIFSGRVLTESIEERKSIAVLPFVNMSADSENEYFSDGITETIITHLSKIADLKVISRTSVMQYKDTEKNLREIADELQVATILEGSVQRAEGRVQITAQLIDAESDDHLWAEQYNRQLTDVFEIQSDVAQQIVGALKATLTPAEKQEIDRRPTDNLQAYDYYLRGNDYFNRLVLEEDTRIAVQMYERAVDLDPNFAEAYAALARARIWLHWDFGRTTELSQGKAALDTALELAPDLNEAHMALGDYFYYGHRDYENALDEYRRVLEREPGNARAIMWIGWIQRRQGKWEEAVASVEKGVELDPRNYSEIADLGTMHMWMRQYPEAERHFDRVIALAPDIPEYHRRKVTLYLHWKGSRESARRALQEAAHRVDPARVLVGSPTLIRLFAHEYAEALDRLTFGSARVDSAVYFLAKAELGQRRNQTQLAREYYDSARVVLEGRVRERPEQFAPHHELGLAYAELGRGAEAIREGQAAVEALRVSKDARQGPLRLEALARIYVTIAEYEAAIDQLEFLLSIPSPISVPLLRVDPLWDPLRDHPRFQALLAKYE